MATRRATEAERALWQTAMRDVRRLAAEPPAPDTQLLAVAQAALPATAEALPVPAMPPHKAPRVPGGVDRATLDRLKRGSIAIEARIDLHGMTQAEAFGALMGFVDTSIRIGRRAVLVITGKGSAAQGGGVLRRNVPNWLNASPLAGRILAIVPAHVRHGGAGAFYVMLRRERRRQD